MAKRAQLTPKGLRIRRRIVEAAGGRATEMDGSPFDGETGRVLATNGVLHAEMTKLLENISQSLARVIVMNAALRIRDRGKHRPCPHAYRFVLQAHDER